MAETAGLVLGAVGVMGVVGAFKDVIDLFKLFDKSRDQGRDYEICNTKLEIEQLLLLQWADRVKLAETTNDGQLWVYDKRLDDPEVQNIVVRTLQAIKELLGDATKLKTQYGLSESCQRAPNPALLPERIGESRLGHVLERLGDLKLGGDSQRKAPLIEKLRWAIRDKEKFDGLIKELAWFTAKLNELVPPLNRHRGFSRTMADEDVRAVKGLGELKIILDASKGRHNDIAESTQRAIDRVYQDHILAKLWFRRMDDRKNTIAAAHERTLRWALEPSPESASLWDDLPEWFAQDSGGIYWISGKAGSGKSTLMKYLWESHRTHQLLSEWATGSQCYRYNFFFAALGTDEQKSREGLSRALLHQILSDHRHLISGALPAMWQELEASEQVNSLPSSAETRYAFEYIATNAHRLGKFCFFVDGLDEFSGDPHDATSLVKDLAASEHIKIVVSSRPIPACVEAFGHLPKLRLQDLTRSDISSYVHDVIRTHQKMQSLLRRCPREGAYIINTLTEKSSGVFLWVVLACRSLLSGFADHDRISELQRRVDEIPPELEDTFQHMLRGISKRHMEQGSRIFRICFAHQKDEDLKRLNGELYALGVALVDDYHNCSINLQRLSVEDKEELCQEMEGRLRSRCGGLIELEKASSKVAVDMDEDMLRCFCGASPGEQHHPWVDAKLVFMHRSVFEFLSNDHVWELECLREPDHRFDETTALSLYGLYLAMQSLSLQLPLSEDQCVDFLHEGLRWGSKYDAQHERPDDRWSIFSHLQSFLDTLDEVRPQDYVLRCLVEVNKIHRVPSASYASLVVAIEVGAVNHVKNHPLLRPMAQHVLKAPQLERQCGCRSLLYYTTSTVWLGNHALRRQPSSSRMLDLLLSLGFDLNECTDDETPWTAWLNQAKEIYSDFLRSKALEILDEVKMFLNAGADPRPVNHSLMGWISEEFIRPGKREHADKARLVLRQIQGLRDLKGAPPTDDETESDAASYDEETDSEDSNDHEEVTIGRWRSSQTGSDEEKPHVPTTEDVVSAANEGERHAAPSSTLGRKRSLSLGSEITGNDTKRCRS